MSKRKIFLISILILLCIDASTQVKIRLFSDKTPESAVLKITAGRYEIDCFKGDPLIVSKGEPVIISRFEGKLAVKARNTVGFICDSVQFSGITGEDSFSLMVNTNMPVVRNYSGNLICFPDMGTLILINVADIEKYIAGVVIAEGGTGRSIEYFKTQAVLARTYMYKYFDKHLADRYNVCDNTHCQVFNGLSDDSVINLAVAATMGKVILAADSTLVIAAFHSNCGGETSSSEDVWLSSQPYLKNVSDPYCMTSRNARWEKKISVDDWIRYLNRSGYNGSEDDPGAVGFVQKTRLTEYKAGSFTIPLKTIRSDLNLRSTFFSVVPEGDSIKLVGKGYGHGVGLCQEGAMVMANRGFSYQKIIDFYYAGVIISDIGNARKKNE